MTIKLSWINTAHLANGPLDPYKAKCSERHICGARKEWECGPIETRAPKHQNICTSLSVTARFILGKLGHEASSHQLGSD